MGRIRLQNSGFLKFFWVRNPHIWTDLPEIWHGIEDCCFPPPYQIWQQSVEHVAPVGQKNAKSPRNFNTGIPAGKNVFVAVSRCFATCLGTRVWPCPSKGKPVSIVATGFSYKPNAFWCLTISVEALHCASHSHSNPAQLCMTSDTDSLFCPTSSQLTALSSGPGVSEAHMQHRWNTSWNSVWFMVRL